MAGSPKRNPGGEGLILNILLNGIDVVTHKRHDDVTTVIVAGLRDQALLRARGTREKTVCCTRDSDTLYLTTESKFLAVIGPPRAPQLCFLLFNFFGSG
jgi:hypothetical protein